MKIVKKETFTIEFFTKVRTFNYKYHEYDNHEIVHEGCFKKEWRLILTRKELMKYLRKWYPNTRVVSFYSELGQTLKVNSYVTQVVTVKKLDDESKFFSFYLSKQKKYNPSSPKKRSRYFCDCYLCSKMSKDVYLKKVEKYDFSISE